MKAFLLNHWSKRFGYEGWALKRNGHILDWTTSTTREEVRQLRLDRFGPEVQLDLFGADQYEIVKVNINVEEKA